IRAGGRLAIILALRRHGRGAVLGRERGRFAFAALAAAPSAPPAPALASVALALGRRAVRRESAGFVILLADLRELAGLLAVPGLGDLLELLGRLVLLIILHDRCDAGRLHRHQRLRLLDAVHLLAL